MKKIFKREAHQVAIFLAVLFAICFAWYFIHPVEQALHLRMFKLTFFGFSEMNFAGFLLGLIQSYIWGLIFVWIWMTLRGKKS